LQELHNKESKISARIETTKRDIALLSKSSPKISELWRVTKEVFSAGTVAQDMAAGPAFRFALLQGPLRAIASSEGFAELKKHHLIKRDRMNSLLDSLSDKIAKDAQMTRHIAADVAHLL